MLMLKQDLMCVGTLEIQMCVFMNIELDTSLYGI